MANSIFLGRLNAEQRKALIERLWHAQGGNWFSHTEKVDFFPVQIWNFQSYCVPLSMEF